MNNVNNFFIHALFLCNSDNFPSTIPNDPTIQLSIFTIYFFGKYIDKRPFSL